MMHGPPAPQRILVVDDSESNLYVVSTWLRRAGYDVSEARTGADASALAQQHDYDLAIIDIHLPDTLGYDLAGALKARIATATALPVLHISATATDPAARSEGLRRGADGFLVLPVEREELIATVEALLRGAAAQRTALALSQRLRQLNEATHALNTARDVQSTLTAIATQAALLFETTAAVLVSGRPDAVVARGSATEKCDVDARAVAAVAAGVRESSRVEGSAAVAAVSALDPQSTYLGASLEPEAATLLIDAGDSAFILSDDYAVLAAFVRAAVTAMRNIRKYDAERTIALRLQQNLLPKDLPQPPGLRVVTRYAASEEDVEVGGDFYEAFMLDDFRVVIAIGDVIGHNLDAAMIMAQLRTGIRCFALEGHAQDVILDRLNEVLKRFHRDVTATICLGVYDSRTGSFEFANAGHIPPLVRQGDRWHYPPSRGTLLGIGAAAPPLQALTLDVGDIVVLYTDGLIERRAEDLSLGMERLRSAAERNPDFTALCDTLLQAGKADLNDDVAVVAIERLR